MTNDVERCDYYKAESQNVKPRYACVLPEDIRKKLKKDKKNRRKVIPITKEDCEVMSQFEF